MSRRPFPRLALALPLALALAATGAARHAPSPRADAATRFGPPWISIEYPPSPYDRATRDAYLLVHAFHHGTPAAMPVSGTAEGLVSGQRRSVTLQFTPTSQTGVYALRKQWPSEGAWALVISAAQAKNDLATALVRIAEDGQVAGVTVPTTRRDGWNIPRAVTAAEVEAALRGQMASR